jgi:hypothetical protein
MSSLPMKKALPANEKALPAEAGRAGLSTENAI